MEYTSSPKPQLSSRANAFSIAALMSSGKPSKDKETEENTIKPLGKDGGGPDGEISQKTLFHFNSGGFVREITAVKVVLSKNPEN